MLIRHSPRAFRATDGMAVVAAAAMIVLGAPGAGAQQQAPANVLFQGEAGKSAKQSLFTAQNSSGRLRTRSIAVVEGARVPDVARTSGRKAGELHLDSAPATAPAAPERALVVLLRRGTLRVTFIPHAKTVLRCPGCRPRRTASCSRSAADEASS